MKRAAIHLNTSDHLLDHIAPLCSQLKMPLFIAQEPSIARHYYPQIEIHHAPDFEREWPEFVQKYDTIFQCGYWSFAFKQMIRDLYQKDVHLVFCPHGQSDKTAHLGPYQEQEIILLYGPLMKDMLTELGLYPPHQQKIIIGNYRLAFYLSHKNFYDDLAEREIFSKFKKKQRTVLYAPTWQDAENSSSFFSLTRRLVESASDHWNWIIKPHPLLEDRHPGSYYRMLKIIQNRPNICLLEHFPPIYPLLNRTDIYVGDASSIGYDFLYFERPMFFAKTTKISRLMQCGEMLDPDSPMQSIEELLPGMGRLIPKQRALYRYAFSK